MAATARCPASSPGVQPPMHAASSLAPLHDSAPASTAWQCAPQPVIHDEHTKVPSGQTHSGSMQHRSGHTRRINAACYGRPRLNCGGEVRLDAPLPLVQTLPPLHHNERWELAPPWSHCSRLHTPPTFTATACSPASLHSTLSIGFLLH